MAALIPMSLSLAKIPLGPPLRKGDHPACGHRRAEQGTRPQGSGAPL